MERTGKCPVTGHVASHAAGGGTRNKDWWPEQIDLKVLSQHSELVNPMEKEFDYRKEFQSLDYEGLKEDLYQLMTDSKDWWPADYGHYGPLFIRMAWHSAGTYRLGDGRGGAANGTQRFAPLNSWPDNVNLDKARRLLWPIKKKYGKKISWADLMILAGNCALESMGVKTFGFAGGRVDVWEPDEDIYWGEETKWLDDNRYSGERDLKNPLAAVQMGLIYVNPEGPNGNPDPLGSGVDVRATFARMAMNDKETVALIAGGHTFGKCHGAGPATEVGPEPEAAPLEQMGLGWQNRYKSGKGQDTIGSGIEGAWKAHPTTWDMGYLKTLFNYEWELVESPSGAKQWLAIDVKEEDMVEDAHDPTKKLRPMMTTADLSLRYDPVYAQIARHYLDNPEEFADAFARAWFKLTHRDMGPRALYLGKEVPKEELLWQDVVLKRDYDLISEEEVAQLKKLILETRLSVSELVSVAWASASTFRGSDKRGGGNGARIRFEPQINWEVNLPVQLSKVLEKIIIVKNDFEKTLSTNKKISIADLIIIAGAAGIEEAARKAGETIDVPVLLGRTDATLEMTDVEAFSVIEPVYDGFRNYQKCKFTIRPEKLLLDKAQQLTLTAPEMTVLLGGLRSININSCGAPHGVFTHNPGTLNRDFFIHLLDMETQWQPMGQDADLYVGKNRSTQEILWTATRVDLVFGSHAQLRAFAEVYASDDAKDKFLKDFVSAWNKVMNADRFDIK